MARCLGRRARLGSEPPSSGRGASMSLAVTVIALALSLIAPPSAVAQSRIIEGSVETDLVSGPVEFAVLLPNEYREDGDRLPLLLSLHGAGGNREGPW